MGGVSHERRFWVVTSALVVLVTTAVWVVIGRRKPDPKGSTGTGVVSSLSASLACHPIRVHPRFPAACARSLEGSPQYLVIPCPRISSGPVHENTSLGRDQELKPITQQTNNARFTSFEGLRTGKNLILADAYCLLFGDAAGNRMVHTGCRGAETTVCRVHPATRLTNDQRTLKFVKVV